DGDVRRRPGEYGRPAPPTAGVTGKLPCRQRPGPWQDQAPSEWSPHFPWEQIAELRQIESLRRYASRLLQGRESERARRCPSVRRGKRRPEFCRGPASRHEPRRSPPPAIRAPRSRAPNSETTGESCPPPGVGLHFRPWISATPAVFVWFDRRKK